MLALGTIAQWWLCIFSIRLWSHVCFTCDKHSSTALSQHSVTWVAHARDRTRDVTAASGAVRAVPGRRAGPRASLHRCRQDEQCRLQAGHLSAARRAPASRHPATGARRLHARRRAGQGRRPVADRRPHHLSPRVARGTYLYVTRETFLSSPSSSSSGSEFSDLHLNCFKYVYMYMCVYMYRLLKLSYVFTNKSNKLF